VIDKSIFHFNDVDSSNRSGFAYYAHKYLLTGEDAISDMISDNGISLCQDIARTPHEIADILRSVKVFYTYEDTALIMEAALCGCIIVLVKTKYTQYSCGNSNPDEMYDHCIDEDKLDINVPLEYNGLVLNNYKERFIDSATKNLEDFIDITQITAFESTKSINIPEYIGDCNSKIFLYGAGRTGHMLLIYLNAINVNVAGFIVTDKYIKNYNDTLWGVPVHTLSWYKEQCKSECSLVLTMERTNEDYVSAELDAAGEKYLRYKDSFNFRSDFSKVMTSIIKRFLEIKKEVYIYGSGMYTDVLYNSVRLSGVNVLGFIVPDQCADELDENRWGLPIILHSKFVKSVYNEKCGVIVSMQYGFILEVLDEFHNNNIEYVITVF